MYRHMIFSCYSWLTSCLQPRSETGSLLPREQHVELPLSEVKKRLVIISDVHGCYDELLRLLEKVEYDPTTTSVICVGDLVAKGPQSAEVVRFLYQNKQHIKSIRGNHEDNALLAHYDKSSKYARREIYDFMSSLSKGEVDHMREFPISISIPELSLAVVHAGVDPSKKGYPIHLHKFSDLIRIRCVTKDGSTTNKNPDDKGTQLWSPKYTGPPFIVFGHDAKRKLQVHPWARGIDTGCVYGGCLTALVIGDTRDTHNWMKNIEIISVAAAKVYNEKDDD